MPAARTTKTRSRTGRAYLFFMPRPSPFSSTRLGTTKTLAYSIMAILTSLGSTAPQTLQSHEISRRKIRMILGKLPIHSLERVQVEAIWEMAVENMISFLWRLASVSRYLAACHHVMFMKKVLHACSLPLL